MQWIFKDRKVVFLNTTMIKPQEKSKKEEMLEHLKYFESGLHYFTISLIVGENSTAERVRDK